MPSQKHEKKSIYYLMLALCQIMYESRHLTSHILGGGQHLERPNVERLIFRDLEISNIKITKVDLFDFSIFEFIFNFYDCLNYSDTQNTYMIIYHQIRFFFKF